jgi:hypothetical protein
MENFVSRILEHLRTEATGIMLLLIGCFTMRAMFGQFFGTPVPMSTIMTEKSISNAMCFDVKIQVLLGSELKIVVNRFTQLSAFST